MRSYWLPLVIVSIVVSAAGCSDYQPAPSRPQPPASAGPASPAATAPAPPASTTGGMPAAPAAAAPSPAAPASTPTPSPAASVPQPEVRLSAGVALPQTLPDGSVMTFSVDYEFLAGRGPTQSRYFLVVQPPQGQAARIPVQLKAKDTLMWISNWPPSSGPFRAHLEDQSGRKLSESVDLR